MKKILSIIIFGVLIISGLGVNGTISNKSNFQLSENQIDLNIDDLQSKMLNLEPL